MCGKYARIDDDDFCECVNRIIAKVGGGREEVGGRGGSGEVERGAAEEGRRKREAGEVEGGKLRREAGRPERP